MDRSLAYRNMNFTLARRDQQGLMSLPEGETEPSRYYYVERKSKKGKDKWIFVRSFWSTPRRAQDSFNSNYQDGQHRLREISISPSVPQ